MKTLNIDSSTVARALDVDSNCDMQLHDLIARLIVAVRLGQQPDILSAAQIVADEYEGLTHVREFDET